MKPVVLLSILLSASISFAAGDAPPAADKPAEAAARNSDKPVSRESIVTIDGKAVPYRVTTGKLQLKKDDGKASASIFHVSYTRTDVKDPSSRPVMFAFNGGPGSSAVWLHIGVLGPKRVELPGDGTSPPKPPVRLIENSASILDVCDLVFIDPVSTGYSRAEKDVKPAEFHGVDADIESVGDFIRRWISDNDRWSSPKFLLGESYGGIRAAGLSQHLQSRYGMSLNGVVMLSTLLDFRTLESGQGDSLSYSVFLPVFTGTALFHGKLRGDRDALIEESRKFAFGDYAAALLKGTELDAASAKTIADRLAQLTGVSAKTWLDHKLRINPFEFRAELLRAEGKTLGRFDGRVAWESADPAAAYAADDPSYSLALGAFSTAMLDYLGRDLGWKEDQPYEILTPKVRPWNWNADNEILNVSDKLVDALETNPHLKVLVMCGRTDLATPPDGMMYSVRQMLKLPASLMKNFEYTHYEGGHMFYLNPPDLAKCRADLVKFIGDSQR